MIRLSFLALVLFLSQLPLCAASAIPVVAAENFYGGVAQQIGGREVKVTSILANPDQDPHLFEATPSVARAIAAARVIVYNGLGYDPWIERLLGAAQRPERKVIVVAALLGRRRGENPHIWYDPKTMPAFAKAFAATLEKIDPAHRAEYERRLAKFEQAMKPIEAKVAALKRRFAGTPVTATEPVFGCMLEALGMRIQNLRFQLAVMHGTEPGALTIVAFERDLRGRQVRMLVYNSQAVTPLTERMKKIALASNIPVVGVTETQPPGENYQTWMASALDAVERALAK